MLRTKLALLSAFGVGVCMPAFAEDLPARPAAPACPPVAHAKRVSLAHVHRHYAQGAYHATTEIAQIRVDGCWQYQPVFDAAGDFYGRQLVKICIDLPPN